MLSKEEKKELLEDGRRLKRRKDFALAKKIAEEEPRLLDSYIRFLTGIQEVFSPFLISRKMTITRLNKL